MSHRPVCVKCQTEMRCEKNGVGCLDMASFGPYELWDSDLYKCPKCGVEILTGFGDLAVSVHHKENFQQLVDTYRNSKRGLVENYE